MTEARYGAWGVTVAFAEETALEDVTLEIPAGHITAVVGGDGAGKSTLMRTMVGRYAPSTGRVRAPDQRRIGYQPAASGSWADLTVAENVEFVGGSYGLRGAELARRSEELLGRAGLADVPDRLAGALSGGMRSKLGFCLAMLHEPELLILDEPTTGVDPVSRVEVWRLISEAAAAGASVALATTYMDEAERAASLLFLEDGRTLLSGVPEDVRAASPGDVVDTTQAQRPELTWRKGRARREWFPDGAPSGAHLVRPDLEDVVIVASLQDLRARGGAR